MAVKGAPLAALISLLTAVVGTTAGCGSPVPTCAVNVDYKYVNSRRSINLPFTPTAVDGGVWGVWVTSSNGFLWHISGDGSTKGPFELGGTPTAVVTGYTCEHGDQPWVALGDKNVVVHIDPTNGAVEDSIPVGWDPVAMAEEKNALWVANARSNSISEIDETGGRVTSTIPVGRDPQSVSLDTFDTPNVVYVANEGDDTVSVIDIATAAVVHTIAVGKAPISVAYDVGLAGEPSRVWVANSGDDTVDLVDPTKNVVVRSWSVPKQPIVVLPYAYQVWVVDADGSMVALDDSPEGNLGQPTAFLGGKPAAAILRNDADLLQAWDVIWVASTGILWRLGGVSSRTSCWQNLPSCSG